MSITVLFPISHYVRQAKRCYSPHEGFFTFLQLPVDANVGNLGLPKMKTYRQERVAKAAIKDGMEMLI